MASLGKSMFEEFCNNLGNVDLCLLKVNISGQVRFLILLGEGMGALGCSTPSVTVRTPEGTLSQQKLSLVGQCLKIKCLWRKIYSMNYRHRVTSEIP